MSSRKGYYVSTLKYRNEYDTKLEGEVFKQFPYESYIHVSNYGRVYVPTHTYLTSLNHIRYYKGKMLHQVEQEYLSVSLHGKTYSVHRLVAQTFLSNLENKATVNHKDGNKWNNLVSNLEWATQRENNLHAFATGLNHIDYDSLVEKRNLACLKLSKRVRCIEDNKVFTSFSECARYYKLGNSTIQDAIRAGRPVICVGKSFEYVD